MPLLAYVIGAAMVFPCARLIGLTLLATTGCAQSWGKFWQIDTAVAPSAPWARSVIIGPEDSNFSAVAADATGNVYAAGAQDSNGQFSYATGVDLVGPAAGAINQNAALVKYGKDGTAQWARAPTTGSNNTQWNSVAVDSSGNIIAAGYTFDLFTYTYGTGLTCTGNTASFFNFCVVKYSPNGTALWAKDTANSAGNNKWFVVATDSANNVVVCGQAENTTAHNFRDGISAAGANASFNWMVVKYNSVGATLWANTTTTAPNQSTCNGVAFDSAGDVIAVGSANSASTFTFTGSVNLNTFGASANPVFLKISGSTGNTIYARTNTVGTSVSRFTSVSLDSTNNAYVAGYVTGTGAYNLGTGSFNPPGTGTNALVAKYDSAGTIQWVRPTTAGSQATQFNSIAVDKMNNVLYAAGSQTGQSTTTYGSGITVSTTVASTGINAVFVKYDASGNALLGKSVTAANASTFNSITMAEQSNFVGAGSQANNTTVTYDPGVSAAGTFTTLNASVVKYLAN